MAIYGSGEGRNSNRKYGDLASEVRRISEGKWWMGGGWRWEWGNGGSTGATVEVQGAGKS